MLVKGHSGFGVELVDELTIRKSAGGNDVHRLKRQIDKQAFFQKNFQDDRVRTPKILRMADTPQTFHADMEFIAARDFIQFLSEADRQALDGFLNVITDFIRRNLKQSAPADVCGQVEQKLVELEQRDVPAVYIQAARDRCRSPIQVPVGPCHGDLTLSNILFKSDHLYLLDFLDCYVESPLQDVVKLRQDTCFGWSLWLYQSDFNWARIQIALRYLDRRIEAAFLPYDWYARHYDLFQLVSLMRVLPYCREERTLTLVTGNLDRMINKSTAKST